MKITARVRFIRARYARVVLMQSKSATKSDDPKQSERFIESAKKAQADESEEGAERAFKKIVAPKKTDSARPK